MMQPEIRHILYYHSTNYYLTHTGQNETETLGMRLEG